MTDSTNSSQRMGPFSFIRNPQDFWGGAGLLVLALVAWWASRNLPGQQGFAFGPGTAPRLFIMLLGGAGIIIMIGGLVSDGPKVFYSLTSAIVIVLIALGWFAIERVVSKVWSPTMGALVATIILDVVSLAALPFLDKVHIRGPYFITLAVLSFASFIRPLGLIISTFTLVVISSAGSREVRWIETLVWAVALSAFCAVLFPYVLNLPMQLGPRF